MTSARVQRGHIDRGDTVLSVAGRRTMGTSRPEPAVVDMDIKQGTAGSVGWIATRVARRRFETLYVTIKFRCKRPTQPPQRPAKSSSQRADGIRE